MPRAVVVVLILAIVVGAFLLWTYRNPSEQVPATLVFSIEFPKSVVAGHSGTAVVNVTNSGGDATGVLPIVVSAAISGTVSSPVDLKRGTSSLIPITITGNDIPDGSYPVVVYLQFLSGSVANRTASQRTSIYLLPNVQLTSVRYRSEVPFHLLPPYKNAIGRSDNTSLLFKVQSTSSSVVYGGLSVSAKLNLTVQGLSIVPSSLPIESIGPHGTTGDYSLSIVSNGAPVGTYGYVVSLYSKDNQLIMQIPELITVTG
jgi:hypothetical protein